jgi:PTH1 family peptidyl-tRNA hydrolase
VKKQMIKLIVGLGNPGDKYINNRHNFGFMLIDALAEHFGTDSFKAKFKGEITKIKISGHEIFLLKPQTYMNNSGNSVGACAQFYKIAPEEILVVHDELDLPFAKVKIKQGGGHGGHNGLRSIDTQIGKNYHRLRLGIGHPGDKDKVSQYVLDNFNKHEKQTADNLIEKMVEFFPLIEQESNDEFLQNIKL